MIPREALDTDVCPRGHVKCDFVVHLPNNGTPLVFLGWPWKFSNPRRFSKLSYGDYKQNPTVNEIDRYADILTRTSPLVPRGLIMNEL